MHDWTLVRLLVEWDEGNVTITFKDLNSNDVTVAAKGLLDLKVPRYEGWGPSVSVNEIDGPTVLENGNIYVGIEMQSGDKIEIEANSVTVPEQEITPK